MASHSRSIVLGGLLLVAVSLVGAFIASGGFLSNWLENGFLNVLRLAGCIIAFAGLMEFVVAYRDGVLEDELDEILIVFLLALALVQQGWMNVLALTLMVLARPLVRLALARWLPSRSPTPPPTGGEPPVAP